MTQTSIRISSRLKTEPQLSSSTPPPAAQRLLLGLPESGQPVSLSQHLDQWGTLPIWRKSSFIDELDRSGLRGHGGAWFPVGAKWRSVRRAGLRRPVVVANGAEGEPASAKDRLLVRQLPHLVLDGAAVAAMSIGASNVLVHVPGSAAAGMRRAVDERQRRGLDPCDIDVVVAPDRFLAGQESAAVNTINGQNPATPSFITLRPVRERGVDGRPTLVQNVESLAHASLIARFGADWFRRVGTEGSPGTALLTVTGRWPEPRILEAPLGVRLGDILSLGTDAARSIGGVLLGGYGGGWVAADQAVVMPLTEEAARNLGSSIGAGVVALLPSDVCPLLEVSRVVRYLEGEGAGQCGPCVNGLDLLANAVELLANQPSALRNGISAIPMMCGLVEGRGACRHPDGVARFVRTALRVFEGHISLHLQRGPCGTNAQPFLPLPSVGRRPGR
jgi:NADH:ubiquinone oxidoreductase subunit F (NADH-binding)